MAKKSIRLSYGAILRKKPGGNYYYRYQVNGCRKMISLLTRNKDQALKKAEELIPVVQATSTEVVAAHVEFAKRMNVPKKSLKLLDSWEYYSSHPERATPATVNEQLQYKSTYKEFLDWLDDPAASVSDVTLEITDRYCQYLKSTNIAVNTHNRKMKRLRRIFKAFHEFRDKQNPFDSPLLFRRQREEQEQLFKKCIGENVIILSIGTQKLKDKVKTELTAIKKHKTDIAIAKAESEKKAKEKAINENLNF